MKKTIYILLGLTVLSFAECQKVIELHSAAKLGEAYGKSEKWVYASGKKINLWEKPSHLGKGRKVGEMYPGSRAKIIKEVGNDYKVISPLDKSVGWINKMQVNKTSYQDSQTHKSCRP